MPERTREDVVERQAGMSRRCAEYNGARGDFNCSCSWRGTRALPASTSQRQQCPSTLPSLTSSRQARTEKPFRMCPGSSTHAQHADARETDGQEAPEGTWQLLVDVSAACMTCLLPPADKRHLAGSFCSCRVRTAVSDRPRDFPSDISAQCTVTLPTTPRRGPTWKHTPPSLRTSSWARQWR